MRNFLGFPRRRGYNSEISLVPVGRKISSRIGNTTPLPGNRHSACICRRSASSLRPPARSRTSHLNVMRRARLCLCVCAPCHCARLFVCHLRARVRHLARGAQTRVPFEFLNLFRPLPPHARGTAQNHCVGRRSLSTPVHRCTSWRGSIPISGKLSAAVGPRFPSPPLPAPHFICLFLSPVCWLVFAFMGK